MILSLRSPKGGNPIRQWGFATQRAKSNLKLDLVGERVITEESYYCIKIGYYENGVPVLIKDHEAFKLYKILAKQFGKKIKVINS